MMLVYYSDINVILPEPIKNKQAVIIHDALIKMHKMFKLILNYPKVYVVGNECSSDLKETMKKYYIGFHLATHNMHHQNATKRDILT